MEFKSILLLKVPYCPYPDLLGGDGNFRTKAPFRPVPSLALAALCAFLDKHKTYDYKVKAVDINIEAYTKPGVSIDTSVYLGLLEDYIKNNDYDVLAISAMFVFNIKWVDMAVRLSRKYHPRAKIIVGGGYPTLFPQRCIEEHGVDEVVIGEGEAVFLHILNSYNNHQDAEFSKRFIFEGYGMRTTSGIKIIQKKHNFLIGEELLAPTWDYFDIDKYFKNSGDRMLPIEASRGCPYNCTYCCTYLSWGRKVRYKPIDNMIDEVALIYEKYKPELLHFVDDNFSFSRQWFTDFLRRMSGLKLPVKIDASNFSVKHIDEKLINLLVKAGINRVSLAVESGSEEIQRRVNKNLKFDHVREVVKMIKSKNLQVHLCWMLGFPGETFEQINSTFNFARELRAHSNQFLTVLPYPGTKLFEEAKSLGVLVFKEDQLDKFDNRKCDYLKSDEWDYKQLQEMIYDVNIELNFLNNPFLGTPHGRKDMLKFLEGLLLRLPEHIIANIIAGYIYKKENKTIEYNQHYQCAVELFKDKALQDVFSKYLSWDYPIIEDFNRYIEINNSQHLTKK
ncbi:MAG: B12-binding domain-containing radical SAM protein [Candidatus Cloacimonetes bacterium]|nr:B12-binding domain-containing radical SAM protein [Candidatus Cloacimonadota bacterium]